MAENLPGRKIGLKRHHHLLKGLSAQAGVMSVSHTKAVVAD
jgi:hypothetical protein